jgi:uncharacterized metal-binding protein YceD (DUF177 family)
LNRQHKEQESWSIPVAVAEVPDTGLHLEIEAPAPVRAQLAELAGARDLPDLSAVFDLKRRGAGVHVAGLVKAKVGQTCVVSLEPVENVVEEAVDVLFVPGAAAEPGSENDDVAEELVDGKVDLGALATEFLLLGIDPYPRKPGAEFAPPKSEDSGEHPFAALADLKKHLGGRQS